MSPRLPSISGKAVISALERAGFVYVSTRGSHVKLRHPTTGRVVIVPLHRELARGTLASILRQAGLDGNELGDLL